MARGLGVGGVFVKAKDPGALASWYRDVLASRDLRERADTAVFLASDGAGAMTGAVMNLSTGAIID